MTNLVISRCRVCREEIVIWSAELDCPICSRVKCFKETFPDDYTKLMKEVKEWMLILTLKG